ncbi:ethanolamine kinase 1-like isoform X2 [Chiloscyllium plagiosum]|uniref:ethanolamine kinase 1-like isoform X2 n=1 Tax=Chiloscyllium plagiosum TaxID=36176 RepID=UPI001CB7FD01|nr:ethanolamine kinase 1-like isoform X2 [Chiloscyllium plagiosum]
MERSAVSRRDTETKYLDIYVDEKEPRNGIEALLKELRPLWKPTEIKLKTFTDGITNKLFGCHVDQAMEDVVLVRIYGNMTELFVDRNNEVKSFQALRAQHCAPDLYCTFQNGMCYEFIKGTVLNMWLLREPSIYRLVAKELARFHSVQTDNGYPSEPVLWNTVSKYLTLLNTNQLKPPCCPAVSCLEMTDMPTFDILVSEFEKLKEHLSQIKSPVVLCHNDLLCKNIIYIEAKELVKFIDYEYTGYNYQAYDIGNHFNEFAGVSELDFSMYPPKELQLEWLKSYLEVFKECSGCEPMVTDLEVLKLYVQVNKFTLASHFSWGLWAVLQARYSTIDFDFLSDQRNNTLMDGPVVWNNFSEQRPYF